MRHEIGMPNAKRPTIRHADREWAKRLLMKGGAITRSKPSVRIKTREQIEEDRKKPAATTPGIPGLGGPLPEPLFAGVVLVVMSV